MLIISRINCIDVAYGIVTLSQWPYGAQVERELSTCALYDHLLRVTIPDAASIQFKPPDGEHKMLETCRGL